MSGDPNYDSGAADSSSATDGDMNPMNKLMAPAPPANAPFSNLMIKSANAFFSNKGTVASSIAG